MPSELRSKPLTTTTPISTFPINLISLLLLSLFNYLATFHRFKTMTTALLYMLNSGDSATLRQDFKDHDSNCDSDESSLSQDSNQSLTEETKSLRLSLCRKRSFTNSEERKVNSEETTDSQESCQTFKKELTLELSHDENYCESGDGDSSPSQFSSLVESHFQNDYFDVFYTHSLDPSNHQLRPISPNHLGYLMKMEGGDLLVIDCRSFMKYNHNHIKGALNACCSNNTIKKRFVCNKIEVVDLVSGQENKELFRESLMRDNITWVLYDDHSVHSTLNHSNNPLQLMADRLSSQASNIRFLSGGMDEFVKSQAHHCSSGVGVETKLLFSPTSPSLDSAIQSATITQILPHLYLGNEKDASDLESLEKHSITHLLNVTTSIPFFCQDTDIVTKRLQASDSASQNIKQYFPDAITFIHEAKLQGGRVLVHCQAGVSRSASISMAYLMRLLRLSSYDAFKLVKLKRSIVSPNINFMGQLLQFEQHLKQLEEQGLLEPLEGQMDEYEGDGILEELRRERILEELEREEKLEGGDGDGELLVNEDGDNEEE